MLCEALAEHRGAPIPPGEPEAIGPRIREGLAAGAYPFDWIGRAAGFDGEALPDDGTELLLRCTAATISPREETGLDPEEESMLISIEHADWLGAIVSAVRAGPGADASPRSLIAGIAACPEVEPARAGTSKMTSASWRLAFSILASPGARSAWSIATSASPPWAPGRCRGRLLAPGAQTSMPGIE